MITDEFKAHDSEDTEIHVGRRQGKYFILEDHVSGEYPLNYQQYEIIQSILMLLQMKTRI